MILAHLDFSDYTRPPLLPCSRREHEPEEQNQQVGTKENRTCECCGLQAPHHRAGCPWRENA